MKEIVLIRHAKSDWGSENLQDIDRPINERGYRDAYFMSEWYLKQKKKPDLIISSSATRALSTAMIFARTINFDVKLMKITEQIYECHASDLISLIKAQDNEIDRLMIFCHNPCITDVCNSLTDDVFIDNVPTCGIVQLNFEIKKWIDLEVKKASVGFFQFPKDFRNND